MCNVCDIQHIRMCMLIPGCRQKVDINNLGLAVSYYTLNIPSMHEKKLVSRFLAVCNRDGKLDSYKGRASFLLQDDIHCLKALQS